MITNKLMTVFSRVDTITMVCDERSFSFSGTQTLQLNFT